MDSWSTDREVEKSKPITALAANACARLITLRSACRMVVGSNAELIHALEEEAIDVLRQVQGLKPERW